METSTLPSNVFEESFDDAIMDGLVTLKLTGLKRIELKGEFSHFAIGKKAQNGEFSHPISDVMLGGPDTIHLIFK